MEGKHTQGEWIVKHSESKDAFNVVGSIFGGNYKIARCPYISISNGNFEAEAEANAKLIAAAPDMLKALLEIVEVMPNTLRLPLTNQIKEIATEAIKKATP